MVTKKYKRRVNFRKKIKKLNKEIKTKKGGTPSMYALERMSPLSLSFPNLKNISLDRFMVKTIVSALSSPEMHQAVGDVGIQVVNTVKDNSDVISGLGTNIASRVTDAFKPKNPLFYAIGSIVVASAVFGITTTVTTEGMKYLGKYMESKSVNKSIKNSVNNSVNKSVNKSIKNSVNNNNNINTSKNKGLNNKEVLNFIHSLIENGGNGFKRMYQLKKQCPPNIYDLSNDLKKIQQIGLNLSGRVRRLEKKTS